MIRPEKLNEALYALHFVLVTARSMAYHESSGGIANLLDWAEALPRFFATVDDRTDEFRRYLEGIVKDVSSCSHLLKTFDDSSAPKEW